MISIQSCFQKDKKSSLYEFLDVNLFKSFYFFAYEAEI